MAAGNFTEHIKRRLGFKRLASALALLTVILVSFNNCNSIESITAIDETSSSSSGGSQAAFVKPVYKEFCENRLRPIPNLEAEPPVSSLLPTVNTETCNAVAGRSCFYVAPNGSDMGVGTMADPFKTFLAAMKLANPGDVIYARAGTYTLDNMVVNGSSTVRTESAVPCPVGEFKVTIDEGKSSETRYCAKYVPTRAFIPIMDWNGWPFNTTAMPAFNVRSGEPGKPITIRNYPGERPVLDMNGAATFNGAFVYGKSHWTIQGFEFARGIIIIEGGTNVSLNPHHIAILENHFHDAVVDGGANVGFIKIDEADRGGPYNIVIAKNKFERLYPKDSPTNWSGGSSVNVGAISVVSCTGYPSRGGYSCGGIGRLEILENDISQMANYFHFKNPSYGPFILRKNRLHDGKSIGKMSAANVLFEYNTVFNTTGGPGSMGTSNLSFETGDACMREITASYSLWRYNTFSGIGGLFTGVRSAYFNTAYRNVIVARNEADATGGIAIISGSFRARQEMGELDELIFYSDKLLDSFNTRENLLFVKSANFNAINWSVAREVVSGGSRTQNASAIQNYTIAQAQEKFETIEVDSIVREQRDPSVIFVNHATGDYRLLPALHSPNWCAGSECYPQ
jgi:hypothetical protein